MHRLKLAQKLALAFIGLVTFVLVDNGALSMWLSYNEARRAAVVMQQEKAEAAAERVEQYITGIEGQLGWTTGVEWSHMGLQQRRYDFIRLLRQEPAITELTDIDGGVVSTVRPGWLPGNNTPSSPRVPAAIMKEAASRIAAARVTVTITTGVFIVSRLRC